MLSLKPYLIIPQLIEQPTWGGEYIASYKNWSNRPSLKGKKIGQSYELTGTSLLSTLSTDSTDTNFHEKQLEHTISLAELSPEDATTAFGPTIYTTYQKMPLLIKFTQAKGNSFQLHKKPNATHPHWQSKAESWYYFEPGYITFGIKEGTNIDEYKKTCKEIDTEMHFLSDQIFSGKKTLEQAREEAKKMVKEKNPWAFVNQYHVPKFTMVDLSVGGLHHSWEEDPDSMNGNVVYEVQQDVADEYCTLRSFDQGKIKPDGTVRTLAIDDYFQFLDPNPETNDIEKAKYAPVESRILTTKNYCMDLLTVSVPTKDHLKDSFAHLFIREGDVIVQTSAGKVRLTKGHSCFIPHGAGSYTLTPNQPGSVVIKTFIEL